VPVAVVRTPAEYETRLKRYLYERSEESRAVRVGEKEVSEKAEIVARYADLFSRPQLDVLREVEEGSGPGERERLYRDVHDGPAQVLANAIFEVEYLERIAERVDELVGDWLRTR